MRPPACVVVAVLSVSALAAQTSSRSDYISRVIDDAVTAAGLPSGYGALIIGYRDDAGTVYKTYGQATVDGTVPLNENTLFGVGSLTKLFTAALVGVASNRGLPLDTPAATLLPSGVSLPSNANRYNVTLLNLADHHAGLPKNEGHVFTSVNDLYGDYAADPITCAASTSELVHDCGCCDPVYMSLLGLQPTCGTGVANPVYACSTHIPTSGAAGWVYSNLGFEVLGNQVATWLGYPDWNQANAREITQPLGMADTGPLESFTADQVARAARHCNPATRTTNVNCQLLDWLPVGNPAGGLFSTASDLLKFMSFNAVGSADPAVAGLVAALPVVHKTYESSPTGGQELAWQTSTLATGELERWKDGANGPFNSWVAYTPAPLRRMIVLLDSSGSLNLDLSKIGYQILLKAGPSISGVETVYGPPEIAQNTWIDIRGTNLVPTTTPPAGFAWSSAPEFQSGKLPTRTGDVSVTVDGKPAFVSWFCSTATSTVCQSDQINVLTPLDTATGPVQVVVTNQGVNSVPFTINMEAAEPAFLRFDASHVTAVHANGDLLGPASLYPGLSRPAVAGEEIVAFGVGFGLPVSPLTSGSAQQSGILSPTPQCRLGGAGALVDFAGLISPGLFQFNLTVPSGTSGEVELVCSYNGQSTPAGTLLTVQ